MFFSPHRATCLLLIIMLSLLSACSTSPKPPIAANKAPRTDASQDHSSTLDLLYRQHTDWRGTPYRLGGQNRSGIDCSAFVQLTYRTLFGIRLPRTTSQQLAAGQRINRSELQPGDLVFFLRGSHVGIYLENDRFLHASTRLGVTISSMNNIYWSRKYWRSIRIRSDQQ